MAILLLPRHLWAFFKEAESENQALDVAIAIAWIRFSTLLASQAIGPIDWDELEVAGGLHGKPLRVVKCRTNDVRVPADSEFVIEGRFCRACAS